MRSRLSLSPLWVVIWFVLLSGGESARGAEPFADLLLPVTEGLEIWLDAAAQPVARQLAGLPPLADGSTVSVWFDGSGQRRHFVQRRRESQPTFQLSLDDGASSAAIRFDGEDDGLEITGGALELDALTVFLVAAPKTNPGYFRGLLSSNAIAANDYTSGFTIDLGPAGTDEFSTLNVEGRGFGGAQNLMTSQAPLGTFHVVRVSIADGERGVQLAIDGQAQGARQKSSGRMSLQEMALGQRFYSNDPSPAAEGCFLRGDIAEVLIFNRLLPPDETAAVEQYLSAKHARLLAANSIDAASALFDGPPPPDVQVLAPGFEVDRLPLLTNNLNDIHYDADGRLWALGYDGRIRVLTDTDDDGLEDHEQIWWNDPPLVMPMSMVLTDQGVIVAVKERLVRIQDRDGDGRGDAVETIVSGWDPSHNYSGGVDALGLAKDAQGALYFGLGTSDYSNGYLLDDQTGAAGYRLTGDRGTIQKVSPDFKTREILCTGIRFPVGIAVNASGDLFCTDQEGATWLPNGNPFDELLHIQAGRHYGFPPRHPKHLPNVIDEPSVVDFAPQHQSTCGLMFNTPEFGGPVFGPEAWRNDAFVCGYSRGKIWRSKLVKTDAGYVARTQLFASLRKLTLDCALAPDGSLRVVTHSGGPDWGSGPNGQGTLYRIRYSGTDEPQPVAIWPASPGEVHVAFDRPLEPRHLQGLASGVRIEYGPFVAAGDRFEELRPGYDVVRRQLQAPRQVLATQGVQMTPDRRTLVIYTDPHVTPGPYALTLPWPSTGSRAATPGLKAAPQIDLQYSLEGVQAEWKPQDGSAAERIWLPHPDLAVAREMLAGSAEHERFFALTEAAGTLTLTTRLGIDSLLRPAVQPGSTLDAVLPAVASTVWVRTTRDCDLAVSDAGRVSRKLEANGRIQRIDYAADAASPQSLTLTMAVDQKTPWRASISYSTGEDDRERALPMNRLWLPWATASGAESLEWTPPEVVHAGNWERGRKLFESEQAQCSKCHTFRGRGGRIGPNLSNLVHRDLTSVMRDVQQPSFTINPDFVSYALALTDGRVLTGVVRQEADDVVVGDLKGVETRVARADIKSQVAQKVSAMPEGLTKNLSSQQLADLMKFLLAPPPTMPVDLEGGPPPRRLAEVQEILEGAPPPASNLRALRFVLVAGPKDHGPGEHDYPAFQKAWTTLLSDAPGVTIETAWEFPSAAQIASADALLFFQHGSWNADREQAIDSFLSRGGGLVYVHWAVDAGELADRFTPVIGLASNGRIKFRHGPLDLVFDRSNHPVSRNFSRLHLVDESYWELLGDPKQITTLASVDEEGQPRPLFWTREIPPASGTSAAKHGGRVMVSIPGHYSWTFDDPLFRILLLRGLCWAAHEPVDRLNELATVGVQLADEEHQALAPAP